MLIVRLPAVAEEDSRLDASAAHLHRWLARICHMRRREGLADAKGCLASTVSKDWRALDVHLLVDVQPVAPEAGLEASGRRRASEQGSEDGSELHCVSMDVSIPTTSFSSYKVQR